MEEQTNLGQWLKARCQSEHLSLRETAAKTGLSHQTIGDIIKGARATPDTIKKLAAAFGNGENQKLALEDKLLILAGYRTPREEEKFNEPLAQLIDAVRGFDESQLRVMLCFAKFLRARGR